MYFYAHAPNWSIGVSRKAGGSVYAQCPIDVKSAADFASMEHLGRKAFCQILKSLLPDLQARMSIGCIFLLHNYQVILIRQIPIFFQMFKLCKDRQIL